VESRPLDPSPSNARPAPISWGALFAGLFVVLATGWLLTLLGSALGVTVADATDLAVLGASFGIGALLWVVVSWLVAYFLGGWVAARLAGPRDATLGMLHGATLWSFATVVAAAVGTVGVGVGVGGVLAAGGVLATAGATGTQVRVDVDDGGELTLGRMDDAVQALLSSELARTIEAELKREGSRLLAGTTAEVDPATLRAAIESLDARTLQTLAGQLATGNVTGAERTLSGATELSSGEIDALVAGVQQRIRSEWSDLKESELARTVREQLESGLDALLAEVAALAGAEVTKDELRAVLRHLDPETLRAASESVLRGDPAGAKDVLVSRTSLTTEEADAVVDGVSQRFETEIDELAVRVEQVTEQAGDYVRNVLWATVLAAALGLAACLAGGRLGAGRPAS